MSELSDLDWTPEGAPVSRRFGDIYFSREDGLAESRAVFLAGCGLPEAWAGRDRFVVAELGFGTGLNIAALLDLWARARPPGGRLHVFSVEAHPLSRNAAARALAAWPEIAASTRRLLDAWPRLSPGFHRIDLSDLGVAFDLAVGDAAWALDRWSGQADAWFLDGFAPSTNPAMWSDAVLDAVAARSAPGARVATFTVAGAVRRGLSDRGFAVAKRPGHGRKRERLEAVAPGARASARPPRRIGVIGAGIAGQSLVRAVSALGATPVVFEAEAPGAGASGFPSALVTPRLDAGDAAIAGLYAQALARAEALYRTVPGAVLQTGVTQLASTARDAARFGKIAAQPIWGGRMLALDDGSDGPRLLMTDAFTVDPAAVRAAWLRDAEIVIDRVVDLQPSPSGWRVVGQGGAHEVDAVVLTAGWGVAALAPDLPLSPVAGQADWAAGIERPSATAWGGYAIPTRDGMLWGATHDRGVERPEPSEAASARNLATLAGRRPDLADRVKGRAVHRRVAVRATTPDRLPACGAMADRPGLFMLTGLGSRGFCAAPLLAEHLAAMMLGAPSPLPVDLARRVAPDRFGDGT